MCSIAAPQLLLQVLRVGTQTFHNLSQIAEFQEAFLLYDNRGDGRIPVALIGDVIRALGQNPTEAEIKKLVMDEHRTAGRVTFEVFLPILQVRVSVGCCLEPTTVWFEGQRSAV